MADNRAFEVAAPEVEAVFTRDGSVATLIEGHIRAAARSFDGALYRFNSQSLARALEAAAARGVWLRLVIDRNKYEESKATQEMLARRRLRFRLAYGRSGRGSKMHHKFAILDDAMVLTGSYNWTLGSEEQNYENLVILRDPRQIEHYQREFEMLWDGATEP